MSVANREVNPPPDKPRMAVAGAALVAVVALAATKVVSVDVGALCAVCLLIWTKCISVEEAYASGVLSVSPSILAVYPCVTTAAIQGSTAYLTGRGGNGVRSLDRGSRWAGDGGDRLRVR
jgi:hypothetical protein